MNKNPRILLLPLLFISVVSGCTPLLVGGGAAGGYKAATDERTIGRMVDDAAITSRIKVELVKDAEVEARKIDVDTLNGLVTLTGVVETQGEARRAEAIAQEVAGVRGIRNNLQIGSRSLGQTLDDQLIGTRIKTSLVGEPHIRSLNIDVDVYGNVVTLTGTVKDEAQKEKVLGIARSTPGVVKVVDNLKVVAN